LLVIVKLAIFLQIGFNNRFVGFRVLAIPAQHRSSLPDAAFKLKDLLRHLWHPLRDWLSAISSTKDAAAIHDAKRGWRFLFCQPPGVQFISFYHFPFYSWLRLLIATLQWHFFI
jgi:hypothetical protein